MAKRKARRRGNGDGSIYQRADGRWCCALRVGGPRGKPIVRYAPTREEVVLKLDQLRTENRLGIVRRTTDLTTVESWLDQLTDQCAAPSTRTVYKAAMRKIVPALGHRPLHRVTTAEIGDWLRGLSCGSRAKQQAYDILYRAFRVAMVEHRITANPMIGVKRPIHHTKPQRPFTVDEVSRILEAVRHDRLYGFFALIFCLGMRQGEVLGLRWADIDWAAGVLIITQAVSRNETGSPRLARPKTKSGIREVPLTDELIRVLLGRAAFAVREGFQHCDLVFPSVTGKVLSIGTIYNGVLSRTLDALGIPRRGMHSGRHSASTFMLRAGVPLHIVSKVLGHSNTSVTSNVYSHVLPGDSAAAVQPLSKSIGYTMTTREPNQQ